MRLRKTEIVLAIMYIISSAVILTGLYFMRKSAYDNGYKKGYIDSQRSQGKLKQRVDTSYYLSP